MTYVLFSLGMAYRPSYKKLWADCTAYTTVIGKDAAMGQFGHACIASAETSRNSFSVAPLAA